MNLPMTRNQTQLRLLGTFDDGTLLYESVHRVRGGLDDLYLSLRNSDGAEIPNFRGNSLYQVNRLGNSLHSFLQQEARIRGRFNHAG